MEPLHILRPDQADAWREIVGRCGTRDFYHQPFYSALASERGEGDAELLVHHDGGELIALPLLFRALGELPCRGPETHRLTDVTSVYGYAGPLCSRSEPPPTLVDGFQRALRAYLRDRGAVTLFSRLHPLTDPRPLLAGLGEIRDAGETVSIDLTLSPEEQRMRYRRTYKRGLNKLRRLGVTADIGDSPAHVAAFHQMYLETMRRVDADAWYLFDLRYFERFVETDEIVTRMVLCRLDGEVVAGLMLTLCDGIAQAHLSATAEGHVELSPSRLGVDEARLWAHAHGARIFHLGGGLGGRADSLFHYKAGFSDQRHTFRIWRWVLDPDAVEALTRERDRYAARHTVDVGGPGFFPPYRCADCRCGRDQER